jgi:hypothetical protein
MRRTLLAAAAVLLLIIFAKASAQSRPPAGTSGSRPDDRVGTVNGNVERGRYIAEQVAMCVECHSGRDEQGNIIDSERYMGAPIPSSPPPWATTWAIRAPRNRDLPGYTDDQAMRLLTEGAIGRDGAQLKLPMPRFRMTRQDAADVIAYLRSLK